MFLGEIFKPPKKLENGKYKPPESPISVPMKFKEKPDNLRMLIVQLIERIEKLERDVEEIKKRVGIYA